MVKLEFVRHVCEQTNQKTLDKGKAKMNTEELFKTLESMKFSPEELQDLREKLAVFKAKEAVSEKYISLLFSKTRIFDFIFIK